MFSLHPVYDNKGTIALHRNQIFVNIPLSIAVCHRVFEFRSGVASARAAHSVPTAAIDRMQRTPPKCIFFFVLVLMFAVGVWAGFYLNGGWVDGQCEKRDVFLRLCVDGWLDGRDLE